MKRCHADYYCKQSNTDRCNDYCVGYVQLQNIYELSSMPKRYQYQIQMSNPGRDLEVYIYLKSYLDSILEQVSNGSGLFIYSDKKGNGKTSWACKMMNEYFKKVALTNNMRCRGLFVNVPLFLQQLRNNMDNSNEEVFDIVENIQNCDLVIWDDIGTENPSNWVRERLYTFINIREANGLSNIYTSNLPPEILTDEKYLGERIVSRISGQCKLIQFVGDDRRKQGQW